MIRHRLVWSVVVAAVAAIMSGYTGRAQEEPAVEHAKRVIDLLEAGQFEEVAAEFNAKMAAAMPVSRLRDVWTTISRQLGARTSIITQRVVAQATGNVTVVTACQFEKAALNVMLSFDAENKIAGMNITPRAPPADESETPPASSAFWEESVTIGSVWALPGTLSMPVGAIAGAVVLVHGSGPADRDETIGPNKPFRDLAWGLANRGVAVLRYEKRTRRYAARMAAVKNFTVRETTIDDALLAAALLRTHDRIDPKRVFVLGHSLGGAVAPRIASEDRSLAGLIILAGETRSFDDTVREQLAYVASLTPGVASPATQEAALQELRRRAPESYWKDFDAYKPAEAAATLTLPTLILQGERDYQVTLED
ncbi:MAG TPA: alpha/beta fold hydrolase, partial [Vicinamibacterales bacterium]|nr:alpha/beta fold hydrolase [Vicinamibacterales bacterium]